MSVRQIMRSATVVLSVPDARKAKAVHEMMTGDVTPLHPGSILRQHPNTTMFLDRESAALLSAPR
jgi:glucosamine-6-phosphate deaminase